MSKANFLKLVNLIKPYAKERSSRVRQDVINLEKRVALALYYLKDQGSMQMTSNTFGTAQCTVGQVIQEICGILTKDLGPEFIKFPIEKDEVLESASQFQQRFGFPQVIGCIHRTDIPIKQPSKNARDYYFYKLCYTLNCHVISNAFGQFINVEVKLRGSVHDEWVFASCDILKGFTNVKFKLFYKELVPGEECVPQTLVGDPAYPLLPYMMKKFEHCKSNEEVIFNQMLRSARNQIECPFGRLKARWWILMRPMDIPVSHLSNVIFTCFVLHNFCEREDVDVHK